MSKIKFDINKEKLLSVFLRYRYLFILIFYSALLAFVFNVMYRYAYVDISFVEYEESYEGRVSLNIKKGNRTLKEVSKNIEERKERFEMEKDIKYSSPFEFKNLDILEDDRVRDYEFDDDPTLSLSEDDLTPSDLTGSTESVEVEDGPILLPPVETENN